jgi:lysozyme
MRTVITVAAALILHACQGGYAYAEDTCLHDCRVDDTGYALIKTFEGYSPFVYRDSVGVPTVGFGHALAPGERVKTPLMGPDALALLERDVAERTTRINAVVEQPLTAEQFDAVASFAYNVGLGNLERSTLLRRLNAGEHDEVPDQFLVWDKAGGREVAGLRVRREAEAKLYEEGTY